MRILIVLYINVSLVLALKPSDSCATFDLPPTFYLRGQWNAYWREKIYITLEPDTDDDAGEEFGLFESLCMSFNGDVELTNDRGNVVGSTDVKTAFNWGSTFNILDCTGQRIWIVDEESEDVIINGLNPFQSVYAVYETNSAGEKGDMIGFAADGDVSFDSKYVIRDMTGAIRGDAVKSFVGKLVSSVSDTTWTVNTYKNETAYPYNMILAYLVALKEVQDQLESSASYDTCTSWALGGIIVASLIGLVLLCCLGYLIYSSCTSDTCGRCWKRIKELSGN
jgi:hypothetical protein